MIERTCSYQRDSGPCFTQDSRLQNRMLLELYSDGPFLVRWGQPTTKATESDNTKAAAWLTKLSKPHGLAEMLGCKVAASIKV